MGDSSTASDNLSPAALEDLRIAATAFQSQTAILVTDAEARIVRVNAAFTRLTGYELDDVIGKNPSVLRSGRHDPAFYDNMWRLIERFDHWQGEIWNRRKGGDIFPEWLTISAVRDADGRLTHYVATFSDISQLKQAESEAYHLAYYDPLTALPNRRLLLDRLGKAEAFGKRSGEFAALLMIDLDNFKTLNDTLGHDQGDQLLIEVARRLLAAVRDCDTVARLGGDEFIVMLEQLGSEAEAAALTAEAVAEKIMQVINEPYRLAGGYMHYCSASQGICLFHGREKTAETVLKQADIAMYMAKDAGRNAIRFFDAEMQVAIEARAHIEMCLRRALAHDEFHLHIQPQVDGRGRLIGAEALLRWRPEGEPGIGPEEFIPIAEEGGLIVPIGLWVLDQACAALARWQEIAELGALYLSVNVSARQFRQSDFVDQVSAALQRHGVPANRLKLELTESILLDKVDEVLFKMGALHLQGVRFSLDDFGTGYASLAYLKRFPFDQLKVDRSFVRDVVSDPDDAAIVRAIIAMGNSLRLDVVAEGVETDQQRAYLDRHGCSVFQGFLFGHPVPVAEFEARCRAAVLSPARRGGQMALFQCLLPAGA